MTSAQKSKRSDSPKARKSSSNETPWHMRSDTLDLLRGKIEAGREMDRRRQSKQAKATSSTMEAGQAQANPRRDNIPGVVGSNPATVEATRDAQPIANAMFEIGKPGGHPMRTASQTSHSSTLGEGSRWCLHIASSKSGLGKIFGRSGAMGAGMSLLKAAHSSGQT